MNRVSARRGSRPALTVLLVVALLSALVPGVAFGAIRAEGGVTALVSDDNIPGYPRSAPVTLTGTVGTVPSANPDDVSSFSLSAGDRLVVVGGYGGSGVMSVKLFGPGATDINSDTPVATSTSPQANALLLDYTVPEGAGGTYYVDVHFVSGLATGYELGVYVVITPEVTFEPAGVDFESFVGGVPPESQIVTVTVSGWTSPTFNWSLYDIPSWLTIIPSSGTAPGVTTMTVSVDVSAMPPGDYPVDVKVDVETPVAPLGMMSALAVPTPDGVLPVHLSIVDPNAPILGVSSVAAMNFTGTAGVAGSAGGSQARTVSNEGSGTLAWTTSNATGAGWLTVAGSGSLANTDPPGSLTVAVHPELLPAGTYNGSVTVAAPGATGSPKTIPVTLTLAKQASAISAFGAVLTKKAWSSGTSLPQVKVTGTLGSPLAGGDVHIYRAYSGGAYSLIKTVQTAADGSFIYTGSVKAKASYKAVFAGNGFLNPSAETAALSVTPYAYLPAPSSSSTVYKLKAFSVTGLVYPAHTSTYPVKLKMYRYESGRWVYKKYVMAKKVSVTSTYVKYKASVSLPKKGTWRIYPEHADSNHLKTPATLAKGYYKRVICK